MLDVLRRLFRYNDWANREALKSLHVANDAPPRAVQLLAHIASAELLWLERIQSVPQSHPVWPEWTVDAIEPQLARSSEAWRRHLDQCTADELSRDFEYTNTKGARYRSKVGDVALHVAMHGTYHRGQIATLLRQHGNEPAYTDFIHAVRENGI